MTDCTACPPNQYFNGAICVAVTHCGVGQREMTAPTAITDRQCVSCTSCGSGQYASTACADGDAPQDRICMGCTACTASQYQTMACANGNVGPNRMCAALTQCVTGERQTTAPTTTTDRVCSACTTCTASQHETVACANGNTSQDRVCVNNMGTCTLVASADGFTDNFSGMHANGTGDAMMTSDDGSTHFYSFVKFNVATATCAEGGTIPVGAVVTNATLRLTRTQSCGACSAGHSVNRVTASWTEGTLPVNVGPTIHGTASATFTPPAVFSSVTISGSGIISDVQLFLGTPAMDHSFRIAKSPGSTGSGTTNNWATREHATAAYRPTLVIDYTTP
jgi:hypothetical protein